MVSFVMTYGWQEESYRDKREGYQWNSEIIDKKYIHLFMVPEL